jgi:hypothetical protein
MGSLFLQAHRETEAHCSRPARRFLADTQDRVGTPNRRREEFVSSEGFRFPSSRAGTTEIPERHLTLSTRHRGLQPRLIIDVLAL